MENEERYLHLRANKQLSDASMADIAEFQQRLHADILKLVTEVYGEHLLTIEAKGYREILERVSIHCSKLAVELDNIVYDNQAG